MQLTPKRVFGRTPPGVSARNYASLGNLHCLIAVAVFISAAMGLTACTKPVPTAIAPSTSASTVSSSALPAPAELYQKARQSAVNTPSLAVNGTFTDENGKEIALQAKGLLDGSKEQRRESSATTGTVDIIVLDQVMYIKGDAKFWASTGVTAAEVTSVQGKYAKITSSTSSATSSVRAKSGPTKSTIGSYVNQAFVADELSNDQLTVHAVTVDNQPAYRLASTDGKRQIFLTTSDPTRVLRVVNTTTGSAYDLRFSPWNTDETIVAPPAAQVYDTDR